MSPDRILDVRQEPKAVAPMPACDTASHLMAKHHLKTKAGTAIGLHPCPHLLPACPFPSHLDPGMPLRWSQKQKHSSNCAPCACRCAQACGAALRGPVLRGLWGCEQGESSLRGLWGCAKGVLWGCADLGSVGSTPTTRVLWGLHSHRAAA